MYTLTPIPTLQTNYVWSITCEQFPNKAVIVDPGEASPVLAYLETNNLQLVGILVTHHHYDHTDGLDAILQEYNCPIYAGTKEPISQTTVALADNQTFSIESLALELTAIHIPGHTKGHIAFYGHDMLFSGDTLFAAGCGRNFEGTPTQLYESLQKLLRLPKETQIYCGHEYTLQNLQFGLLVEPSNQDIRSKLELVQITRTDGQCTLPSSLADEINTNIFLRCKEPAVRTAAEKYAGTSLIKSVDVFATLRHWKNNYS